MATYGGEYIRSICCKLGITGRTVTYGDYFSLLLPRYILVATLELPVVNHPFTTRLSIGAIMKPNGECPGVLRLESNFGMDTES